MNNNDNSGPNNIHYEDFNETVLDKAPNKPGLISTVSWLNGKPYGTFYYRQSIREEVENQFKYQKPTTGTLIGWKEKEYLHPEEMELLEP